jgi:hypothetical protein
VRKLYRLDVSHRESLMPDRHCLELPAYSLRPGAAWDTNNVRLGTQSKSARVVPSWPYYLLCLRVYADACLAEISALLHVLLQLLLLQPDRRQQQEAKAVRGAAPARAARVVEEYPTSTVSCFSLLRRPCELLFPGSKRFSP